MLDWKQLNNHLKRLLDLEGRKDVTIRRLASSKRPVDGALIFASDPDSAILAGLENVADCVVILPVRLRERSHSIARNNSVIIADDPRYRFAEILNAVAMPQDLRGRLFYDDKRHIYLGTDVKIDPSAYVEPGASISTCSKLEAGAYVMTGARIGPNVTIGMNSVIKENCVVGGWGYGYALSHGKPPLRLPHLGGVKIGDDCEVGSFTTVCSGTIEPTIIRDHAKIDDHVHIAHNCDIGEGAMVVACAEVSGSVKVGRHSWLGPNCSIIDRITIGEDCVVGMGAVVLKSMPDGSVVAGNPAKLTTDLKRQSELLKRVEAYLEVHTE
ncbi:MAG: UDP-3-O-(3-hydroxymyristoyl)glucosamine N-acyltransferase [Candidatus Zixiibacteriota bacterium]